MPERQSMASLREIGADEASDTQACFRDLMGAFAEPARWCDLRAPTLRARPSALYEASYAVLKTLCDHLVGLWISPVLGDEAIDYIRLNLGVRMESLACADYVLLDSSDVSALGGLRIGYEEFPERSALAIIQVPEATAAFVGVKARGPGIRDEARFEVACELAAMFEVFESLRDFPLGIDLLLTRSDGKICALPRTSEITWPM